VAYPLHRSTFGALRGRGMGTPAVPGLLRRFCAHFRRPGPRASGRTLAGRTLTDDTEREIMRRLLVGSGSQR